ncbi:MAG TPA: DUF5667 domain-containing protein [Pseudonocardiaceae bacterium]|nr:DUF5667 domain-containing protein [Pseudonocardiaceae bacterium]
MNSGTTPWWRHRRQRERFARAVDSSPESTQPYDPKLAGELAVVVMLRRTAPATAPDADAAARMRAKVLAELAIPAVRRPSPVPRAPAPRAPARGRVTGTRGRVVIALGAAFCLVLALSGMTLLLARNALPGDPLYAVRRTVESVTLGLTGGDDSKGRKHLEFAADRVGDIESLVARYPDLNNSPVGDYLTAFADFDSDATAGAADLTGYAAANGPAELTTLRDWANQQAARIKQLEPGLPGAARDRAGQSIALLGRITQRANALLARNSCYTITSGATDGLGVLPATGPCDQRPGTTRQGSGQPTGTGGTRPAQAPGTPVNTSSAAASNQQATKLGPTPTTFPAQPPVIPAPILTTPLLAPPPTTNPPITITLPLPLPGLNIPALLPGLPTLHIGQ